jgi:nucleotide-binding universal stress UspA family protein
VADQLSVSETVEAETVIDRAVMRESQAPTDGKQPRPHRSAVNYGRILVPVTPSTASKRALMTAALLASDHSAVITLVHVIEVPKELPLDALFPEEEREGLELLRQASSVLDRYSVNYKTRSVRSSTAAEAILEAAQDTDAQILIIGADHHTRRRRTGFDRDVETVLRKATCRVMLVTNAGGQDSSRRRSSTLRPEPLFDPAEERLRT